MSQAGRSGAERNAKPGGGPAAERTGPGRPPVSRFFGRSVQQFSVVGWARCALQKTFRLSLSLERTVAHYCLSAAGLLGYVAHKAPSGVKVRVLLVVGWVRCALQKTFRLSLSLERTVAHHVYPPPVWWATAHGKRRVESRFPECAPSPPYGRSFGHAKISAKS